MDYSNLIGRPDQEWINMGEDHEMVYWSNKFGVSVERLKSAVRAVGNSITTVEKYLLRNNLKTK